MKKRKNVLFHIVTNVALALLIFSVGFACLYPTEKEIPTGSKEFSVFRKGKSVDGVSLMFNVYESAETVERILDILREYDAKATFFIGGVWAEKNDDCVKKIAQNGHEIGNHGYFHKDHDKLSEQRNKEEISACNALLEGITGVKPTLFAPPSGAYGENTLSATEHFGMKTVLWTKDTVDWRDKKASVVYTRATKNVGGGDFILMHPKPHTADALPDILTYYKKHALRAITVTENLQIGE